LCYRSRTWSGPPRRCAASRPGSEAQAVTSGAALSSRKRTIAEVDGGVCRLAPQANRVGNRRSHHFEAYPSAFGGGLPELDAISFGIHDPGETPVLVFFAARVDFDTFFLQRFEEPIEVGNPEVHHESR
jgi:hypothetical protein